MSKAATLPLSRTPRGRESERMARKRSPWCMERKKERRGRERGQQPGTPAIRPVSPMLDGLVRCMYNGIPMRRGGGKPAHSRGPLPRSMPPPRDRGRGEAKGKSPATNNYRRPPRPSFCAQRRHMDGSLGNDHALIIKPQQDPPSPAFLPYTVPT